VFNCQVAMAAMWTLLSTFVCVIDTTATWDKRSTLGHQSPWQVC
jgi:hypothetical protein